MAYLFLVYLLASMLYLVGLLGLIVVDLVRNLVLIYPIGRVEVLGSLSDF